MREPVAHRYGLCRPRTVRGHSLLRAHEVHALAQRVEKRRPHIERDAVIAPIHIQDELCKAGVAFERWCRQGPRTHRDWKRSNTGCRAKQPPAAHASVVLTRAYLSNVATDGFV